MTLKIHNCVCVRSTGDASKLAAVHLLFSIQMSCNKKKSIALQQCIDKHVWLNPFQISVHTFHLCAYYVHRSLISINRTLVPIPFQDFSMHKTSLCLHICWITNCINLCETSHIMVEKEKARFIKNKYPFVIAKNVI